ncbi:hypothetical protein CUMW_189200 [Citrus unshiu]|nr:hypothetical protein CUMW_189200 [Citrus unshiu]
MAKSESGSGFSLSGSGPGCHFLSPGPRLKPGFSSPGSGALLQLKKGQPMMNRGAASLRGCDGGERFTVNPRV